MSDSIQNRYDYLIFLCDEEQLDEKEVCELIADYFPEFDIEDERYEEFAVPSKFDMFGYYRSLGLPIEDAAHNIHYSATLIKKFLEGDGISLKSLLYLAKSEMYALAEIKAKHLIKLDEADHKGASLTFLEKVFPNHYGKSEGFGGEGGGGGHWNVTIHHVGNQSKENEFRDKFVNEVSDE